MTPAELTDAERSYDEAVSASLRRNYLALLAHGMLGQTGFRLLQAPTFLPTYIFLLSGSQVIVGLALAAQHIGAAFASIPGGNLVSHRKRVLPVFFGVGTVMRLQVLGIALAGFFLEGTGILVATCLFLFFLGLSSGMQTVAFQFTMSKLIPVSVRGKLTGFRSLMAGILSSAVAVLGGSYFIENNTWGNGYATTFLVAFALTAIGLLTILGVREPEPPSVAERSSLKGQFSRIPDMMRAHPGLLRFILARGLAGFSVAAVPFYILFAGETTDLSGADLGILTAAFLLMQTLFNFAWGALADRTGNRIVYIASVAIWAASVVLLLLAPHQMIWLILTFCGLGIGIGGFGIGAMNMILEFGTRQERPMLIGIANAANSFTFAAGPILGGLFAAAVSYAALFWIAVALKVLSIMLTLLAVEDPRQSS